MLLFLVAVQFIALAITPAISATDNRVFEDPASISNPIIYMLLILIFTGFLLLAIKLKGEWLVSAFILISIAVTIFYVMAAIIPAWLALLPTLAVMLLLHYYPEWYIIDAFGILVCAGISSLLGVSMTILPVLILLVILAVYDAISVYKTRHMVSLAEGAIKMKAPLLICRSQEQGLQLQKQGCRLDLKGEGKEKNDRGAYFLGLGDAIIPIHPGHICELVISSWRDPRPEPSHPRCHAWNLCRLSPSDDHIQRSPSGWPSLPELGSHPGIFRRLPCRGSQPFLALAPTAFCPIPQHFALKEE